MSNIDNNTDSEGEETFMPFVAIQSAGGPYEDKSFSAGWQMGEIAAELKARTRRIATFKIFSELYPQADLIGMQWGYLIEVADGEFVDMVNFVDVDGVAQPIETKEWVVAELIPGELVTVGFTRVDSWGGMMVEHNLCDMKFGSHKGPFFIDKTFDIKACSIHKPAYEERRKELCPFNWEANDGDAS